MGGKTKDNFRITPQHRRFIKRLFQTGNQSEAARYAKFETSYGRDLSKHPAIIREIKKLEEKAGLSDELLLKTHVDLLKDPEANIRLGAVRLGYQVKKKIGAETDAPPPGLPPMMFIIRAGEKKPDAANAGKDRVRTNTETGFSIRRPNK